jgi:alpha-amylase
LLASIAALQACRSAQAPPPAAPAPSTARLDNAPPAASPAAMPAASPAPGFERYNGDGSDVMLQGFHWTSQDVQQNGKPWYQIMTENAGVIKDAGFTCVWFPPPSKTADSEGYLPNQWYELDARYGTKAQLVAAVKALRPARALADIVVNHRTGTATAGADFTKPAFADNAAGVVREDECACGRGNADTGEGNNAGRDLDHTNGSVRAEIQKWQAFLKQEIGFAGWRYDQVKGYGGSFVGDYNDASQPYLSVGEYLDGDRQKVVNWVDATRGRSMAFDFPTRFRLFDALTQNNFGVLKTVDGKPTGTLGWWPAMSVTFVENHDFEEVRRGLYGPPFPRDKVLQAYAYILTHPGVPCVFWRHFFDAGDAQKQKLKTLIQIRKRNRINSRSVVDIRVADNGRYAAIVDGKVAVKIGPADWSPGAGWRVAADGEQFAVWERN